MQHSEKVKDYRDEHHSADYSQAPARSPSGVSVIAATTAEQQQQNKNYQ